MAHVGLLCAWGQTSYLKTRGVPAAVWIRFREATEGG